MSGSIPFILDGSFVHPNEGIKPGITTNGVKTNLMDISMTFQQLLESVKKVHDDKGADIFCNHRRVVLVPKQVPHTNPEIIQLFKQTLSKVFSEDQIYQISCGNFKVAFKTLSESSKQIIKGSLAHFLTLNTSNKFYTSPENKEKFVNNAMKFFTPTDLLYSFLAPIYSKDSAFGSNASNMILVGNNGTLVAFPGGKEIKFEDLQINEKTLSITLRDSTTVHANYNGSIQLIYNFLDKSVTPTHLIIQSIKQFNGTINIHQAEAISWLISHCDVSFIKHLYTCLPTDASAQFEDIITLFERQGAVLRLIKYLACAELRRTGKSNEIFRQNNHFIRGILFYFKYVSKSYLENVVSLLLKIIDDAPAWSYDKPAAQDLVTVEKLLIDVWDTLTKSVPKLPPGVRRVLRSLRILSEHEFSTPEMNHRSCFALFMLRFLFIELTDPSKPNMDPKKLSKVLVFTKLLAFAGQMQNITGEHNGGRTMYNEVIKKTIPHGVAFYEKLTEYCEMEHARINDTKLINAATNFVKYINEKSADIEKEAAGQHFYDAFASEGIAEFYVEMNKK